VLDINPRDLGSFEAVDSFEGFEGAVRIVNGDRSVIRESGKQRLRRTRRARVGQRLIKRVAATGIIKGLDAQCHQ